MEAFVEDGSDLVPDAMPTTSERETAAHALWLEHYGPLAGWCAALLGNTQDAHDVAAEAFTRLLSRWVSVREPKGFLHVTALNEIRDRWRRAERGRRLVERLGPEVSATAPGPHPWLGDLVRRLPEKLQRPIVLHYYADLPVESVANALHRPVGTIKRQLAEGRAQLLTMINRDPEGSR